MSKELKIIKLAFKELGFEYSEEYTKFKDFDTGIEKTKGMINAIECRLEELLEILENAKKHKLNLELIKQQIEIEEYRLLNPHAKEVFKL